MNQHNIAEVENHIKGWIDHVSHPQQQLGNLPVCPFAKKTAYQIISMELDQLSVPETDFKLIIFILPDSVTEVQMAARCLQLNAENPEYVFLPDHKNKRTYIKDVVTNNCKYNLVMCQPKGEIEKGRESLAKTKYYTFFDSDYWDKQCEYQSMVPDNHWSKPAEAAV